MEQMAFNLDIPRSKEKMRAAARTVVGMWEEEYYEEHSEYLDFPKRMVTPKPYQYPHPPVWMAAVTEGSAQQAGQDGLGMLCFGIMQPLTVLRKVIGVYREAQKTAKPLTSVHTNKVGVYTLVHCAESRAKFDQNRLWDSMWWWYKGLAEFTLKWEFAHLSEEQQAAAFPLLEARRKGEFDITEFDREDMVIVGDPDECLQKFLRYEEAGIDQVLCYINFGYLPNEAVLKSIELLGKYVIPELKKRGADNSARSLETAVRRVGT
jgi:alkanesulfonate monooxygenase SsuD/methylene tetrahydromethanopterin reductase-like flavin-dependent oxidoreductase (luciferase family)